MKAVLFSIRFAIGAAIHAFAVGVLLTVTTISGFAAATLTQQINPSEATVGDDVAITFTIQSGSGANIHLPAIDGLQSLGTTTATNISFNNGAFSSSFSETFHVSPAHAGDFTIPTFDIHLQDGSVLHTQAMKIHVLESPPMSPGNPQPSSPSPAQNPPANPPSVPAFNPNGPVVMPPNNGAPTPPPADNGAANATNNPVPTESDGRPAKVFVLITPQTTDAYVGQSIPLRIEWYIRLDVDAQQDSLPTIKGSDFLLNNLSVRPREDTLAVMNEGYRRESWFTAISAPKSGNFPLQMERDSYWLKSNPAQMDPFTNFFPGRPNLGHESIPSNQFTIHVHSLPTEGRPANFSGAIGQFTATGGAQPASVAIGEPVTLHFTVTGQGNFDYVRCPTLADDPAWKTYVPSSKTNFQDESRTQGTKDFEMAVIPLKNGSVPLPPCSFSYFDASAKQYVTLPINLPTITVTGSMTPSTTAPEAVSDATTGAMTSQSGFRPNRIDSGATRTSLTPAYRHGWFWAIQGGLLSAIVLALLMVLLPTRSTPSSDAAARLERENSLGREVDAMSEAVQRGDAHAFFLAARHAIQLHLGTRWRVKPETLTLVEIRQRDPELAQSLEPLFLQADEIIYSGGVGTGLDLAQWARHVREFLQPQAEAVRS
jgi:hypothetical protein